MTKMLIISSDTPEEDMQAAFTIVRETCLDDKLEKITWYCNFAKSLTKFDERLSQIERDFRLFAEAYNKFGIEARQYFERLTKVEKTVTDLNKPQKEKK